MTARTPPEPRPTWTVWKETVGGVEMARVRLDVGQYSFRAGKEVRGDFLQVVADLISATTLHAEGRGWI